jgi:hypothetical protein
VHIQIEAQDPSRYRAAFRHILRRRRVRRVIVIGILAVLGVAYLFVPSMRPLGVLLLLVSSLFLLLPAIGARSSMRRLSAMAALPTYFELTDQYVRSVTPLHLSQMSWAAFTSIEEIPGQLLLMPARLQVISVPTTGLRADQLAELRAFLAHWTPTPGAGRAASAYPGPAPSAGWAADLDRVPAPRPAVPQQAGAGWARPSDRGE